MLEDITLVGSTVELVPLERSHTDELFQAGNHQAIWTYLPKRISVLKDMMHWVDEALAGKRSRTELPFAVMHRQMNKIVGSTRFLNISEPNKNLEIGWTWYSPEVWRSGVNTDCKYMLLTYCFEQLGYVRVQFKADIRNERSNNAIRRIGATHEGILRKDRILPDGYIRNSNIYSITADEWPEVKNRFETKLLRGMHD
ncbi:GNAT family N-acetyltransferase [Paenibacillus allorhizosphaerae]|nr:GNAT family protein [Paenibacillus allorhizosphaerae]